MADAKWKIEAKTAQEVCAKFAVSESARPYLKPDIRSADFLDLLVANSVFVDAVQFLAYGLPKREAVWWSCICTRELPLSDGAPQSEVAIKAAEEWVYRPNEENRRGAEKAGNAVTAPHPSRWSAMAAFWSGGSIASPDAPEVKAPDDFTAKAVAGAVLMAAGLDPKQASARQRLFLDYGVDIAKGGRGRSAAP